MGGWVGGWGGRGRMTVQSSIWLILVCVSFYGVGVHVFTIDVVVVVVVVEWKCRNWLRR